MNTLLQSRRFLPLFVTQFLGALNDNLFKNALVMLVTYRIAAAGNTQLLVTLAAALFIAPYFIFSATAGQCADKYDRAALSRIVKLAEIVLMALAAIGFALGSVWFLLFVLFLMGVQATFFGPIKYALLPQHLQENELLAGNSYIEAGTFLAILIGTIMGGVLAVQAGGALIVAAAVLIVAGAGYAASRSIPPAPAPEPGLRVNWNIVRETWEILRFSHENIRIWRCILGISWFWLIGATFLAQFPTYAKDVLGAGPGVVTLFLTVFSVGVGLGSMACSRLTRGRVESTYVPLAALGLSLFTADLYFASHFAPTGTLLGAWAFLSQARGLRILADLLLIAICGGIYIVPLYAILQQDSPPAHRARIIAANNVVNALFMVASALATLLMLWLSFTIPQVFLAVGVGNLLVAIYICTLLPDALLRSLARAILRLCYRVEVRGLEHYKAAGPRVLLIANHTSFLDPALIAAFLPEKITFAVNTQIARRWWMQPLLAAVDAFPLDPTKPLATKALVAALRENRKCMIFPEGRITTTGALMKIYEGPGMIVDRAGATLLPIRIDGAQYTPFSRLRGKLRLRWFPRITLTILPPVAFQVDEALTGKQRRARAGAQLYDLMSRMMFESTDTQHSLFSGLLAAQAVHGGRKEIVEDTERKPLTYRQFITRSTVLGRVLSRNVPDGPVGVLLPTSNGCALTFFALQSAGRVPAMLNFTSGAGQILSCCRAANVSIVATSRKFIEAANLQELAQALSAGGMQVLFLEDLRKKISPLDKLFGVFAMIMPSLLCKRAKPEDAALILFTSGSEGTPKGVALSHTNILSNIAQLSARVDFGPTDRAFNCLPMFHSFGLTAGTLLPLLSGIKAFFYPSPLHYRIVPELVYDTNATMFFGTDTFLSGYAKFAHPYDFHSVRYIFAGAEKLKEETRRTYTEKYGTRIFEGYGVTETSPVLAVNTPMQHRAGTVGRFMPGVEWRLEPVEGITQGGRLWVKGPNIMLGYYRAESPGLLQPPPEGWYDTGDVVSVDAEGFITICGRAKRFAKIGGEMVSLAAVEMAADARWPGHAHAAVAVPDAKKGEQVVLLTDCKEVSREVLLSHFQAQGLPELALPRKIMVVEAVPLLGTGKIDYVRARALALEAAA